MHFFLHYHRSINNTAGRTLARRVFSRNSPFRPRNPISQSCSFLQGSKILGDGVDKAPGICYDKYTL
ncbi:MAG: hypothetical protein DBY25_00190 [Clostridiales bacterium]|nr:MAG: hypothetical protein DBY25_00190 [Clostridiales bacterium]